MRRFLFVTAALLLFMQTGCTQSIRYTEEEIKGYAPRIQEDIRKGQIEPGMTQEQVRYAWGSPDSITRLEAFESKSREEWIYSHPFTLGVVGSKILVFYDGRLIYIR